MGKAAERQRERYAQCGAGDLDCDAGRFSQQLRGRELLFAERRAMNHGRQDPQSDGTPAPERSTAAVQRDKGGYEAERDKPAERCSGVQPAGPHLLPEQPDVETGHHQAGTGGKRPKHDHIVMRRSVGLQRPGRGELERPVFQHAVDFRDEGITRRCHLSDLLAQGHHPILLPGERARVAKRERFLFLAASKRLHVLAQAYLILGQPLLVIRELLSTLLELAQLQMLVPNRLQGEAQRASALATVTVLVDPGSTALDEPVRRNLEE